MTVRLLDMCGVSPASLSSIGYGIPSYYLARIVLLSVH